MSNDNQPIDLSEVRNLDFVRLQSVASRLSECIDELDALGRHTEANYVSWGRDLILQSCTDPSRPRVE